MEFKANKIIYILFISFIWTCCGNEAPNEQKQDQLVRDTLTKKDAISASKDEATATVLAYTDPKSIDELLRTIYVVDTLYRLTIPNDLGNDDDEYQMIFNELLGITKSTENQLPKISAAKVLGNFDPVFSIDSNQYLIPFHVDAEREWTIFTIWKREGTSLRLSSYFKNLWINKYGRLRVVDFLQIGNKSFLLIEKQAPSEEGIYQSIYLASSTDFENLQVLKEYDLALLTEEKAAISYQLQQDGSFLQIKASGAKKEHKTSLDRIQLN